ncbi:MAG: sodium:proton antiporter [Neisseria sp.]|nr:sodium:proton antiporter [Neisseria sp.]
MYFRSRFVFSLLSFLPLFAAAADYQPASLSLWWGAPFALILLSVALCPLFLPRIWHHHFGKIIAGWTVVFLLPFALVFGMSEVSQIVAHAVLEEYVPFILLLLALYTVSGGILVWGNLHGNPQTNTALLAIGTVLASLMGTTGAAMLLIRPLLRANDNRKHKVHVVIFFIFLVANIGGGLTPLGDPPLFLGFLKGVDFMWTVKHMMLPVVLSSVVLLTAFFFVDRYFYRQEGEVLVQDPSPDSKLKIYGKINLLLLLAVVGSVLMSGLWKPNVEYTIFGISIGLQALFRDILMVVITVLSLLLTPKQVRAGNEFNWEPMKEVGKLFLGIFITIAPVLAMLKAGEAGNFRSLIQMVHNSAGEPINAMYFWMSGMLSAFLDNAPTYLVFFNMASGDAAQLMGNMAGTLLAVSMGSVFMGALTYIGNAPNFMVKAIAEQRNVEMPTFFGYMAWSFGILVPLFIVQTVIFFW